MVGLPVLYVDRQEDGVWSPGAGEEVIGGSYDTVVIYSTRMPDRFAAEAGDHAATGFVPVVVDDRDLCAERATGDLVLQDSQPAHLYVGTLTPALRDILANDPTWTGCLRAECPEVISGIEEG